MHLERETPTCTYIHRHLDALTASATHLYNYLLPGGIHSNRQLAAASKHEHEHGILMRCPERVCTSLRIV